MTNEKEIACVAAMRNTLEQMMADAEDAGREGVQPMLTFEDVHLIMSALTVYAHGLGLKPMVDHDFKVDSMVRPENAYAATVGGMLSSDYKERFKAEYQQTKMRYEKLKAFCNKIEAATMSEGLEEPKHDCPLDLLRKQQRAMGEYLYALEVRAVIENVDL
jgi:hypothetical protein